MIRYDVTAALYGIICYIMHCPRRILFICTVSFVCFFPSPLLSQDEISVSQTGLKFLNDRLIIKYDILGSKPGDIFRVWLEITDSTGAKIAARYLYGDIGDDVPGGLQKQVIWDLAADSLYLNMDVNVEIFAAKNTKPVAVAAETPVQETKPDTAIAILAAEQLAETKDDKEAEIKKEEELSEAQAETKDDAEAEIKKEEELSEAQAETEVTEKKEETEPQAEAAREEQAAKEGTKSAQVGTNLLLSTVCPGWGLTRLSGGKPYWLIGVVGYGCIASSYYLNTLASSNYDKYLNSSDINQEDEMDDYYNTGKKQYTASNVLALSAIAIWVADLGVTWIKASKMKRSAASATSGSFSVGSSYDYYTDTPLISFFYTF